MSRAKNWRYHAAKRRQFAAMYGAPTGRIPSSPMWQHFIQSPRCAGKSLATADYSAIEQRILAHMSMSRDRVRFNIAPYGSDDATRNAFTTAFGVPFPSRPMGEIVVVICRPSQFARFMIFRNDFGGRNSFKELCPVLFTPEQDKVELDVSRNPAG